MKVFRKTFIVYIVILAAAVLYYLLTGSAAGAAAIAVTVFYGVFALVSVLAGGKKLTVTLPASAERSRQAAEPMKVVLKNESRFPVVMCELPVRAANLLTGETAETVIGTGLFPRGRKEEELQLQEQCCGMVLLSAEEIRITDPLRLFGKTLKEPVKPTEILILPELHKEDIDPETLWRYDMESFRFAEGKTGADTSETVGIRDYIPGDSIRQIHWKLSAKTGTTLIKEAGLPVDNRLMVLGDKKIPAEGITPARIDSETARFLSVSWSLLEKELHHTLGWYDARREEYITETVGEPDDLYRIMPGFLSAPWTKDGLDAGERFIEAETEKNFASYLIIAPSQENCEAGLERMRDYGNVTVLTPENRES